MHAASDRVDEVSCEVHVSDLLVIGPQEPFEDLKVECVAPADWIGKDLSGSDSEKRHCIGRRTSDFACCIHLRPRSHLLTASASRGLEHAPRVLQHCSALGSGGMPDALSAARRIQGIAPAQAAEAGEVGIGAAQLAAVLDG